MLVGNQWIVERQIELAIACSILYELRGDVTTYTADGSTSTPTIAAPGAFTSVGCVNVEPSYRTMDQPLGAYRAAPRPSDRRIATRAWRRTLLALAGSAC